MAPSPEAMVLLFDAVMIDDDALLRCLLRRFPLMRKKASELSGEERQDLYPARLMTNHFYTWMPLDGLSAPYKGKKSNFGLVLVDTPTAKVLASQCDLFDYIHWGSNTDPVKVATVADIAEVLEASEEHATPVKVLSLLKEVNVPEGSSTANAKRVRSEC